MIEAECECGRVVKTKDENAGKKAKCPDCGEIIQIPALRKTGTKSAAAPGKGAAASTVKSTKRRRPPEDEFDDGSDGADEDFGDEDEAPRPKSKKPAGKKPVKGKAESGEPVKKKKKKDKSEETELNKKIIIGTCIFFGVAFLGLAGYGISQLGKITGGPKVEAPKEFVDFSSTNGELRCQAPKGWKADFKGGSGGVPPVASFVNENVRIEFRSSPSGASFQMIAQAGGGDEKETPDEEKAVSKIHEIQRSKFTQEMSGYEEQGPAEMVKTAGFGEAKISAFTASAGFSKVFGYRATLLGTNNQWVVTCKCTGEQWKDFQPVFRKVILSAGGS